MDAVLAQGRGYLRVYPGLAPTPNATFLNYGPGQNIGNTGAVTVNPGAAPQFQVRVYGAATHVVIDVNGYDIKGLHASYGGNGAFARGNGVTTSSHPGTGLYRVNVDRDVRGCADEATIGKPTSGTALPGFATAERNDRNITGVFVHTYATNGTAADRPFNLTVTG